MIDQFVKKYDGKQVEYHSFGSGAENQCTDLCNQFIKEVLNLTPIIGTHAKDFLTRAGNEFDKIKNTPTGVPNKGDIVVWGSPAGGGYGHVGIFLEGSANSFKSFDQNYSLKQRCKIENHKYNNVIGWLHPKGETMMYKGLDLTNQESMKACVDIWKDVSDGKYVKKDEADKLLKDEKEAHNTEKKVLEQQVKDLKKQYDEDISEIAGKLQSQLNKPSILAEIGKLISFEDKNIKLEKEVEDYKKKIETMKENGTVIVKQADHSRLCAWLATKGL